MLRVMTKIMRCEDINETEKSLRFGVKALCKVLLHFLRLLSISTSFFAWKSARSRF